ncbi:MAG: hypothetical protein OEN21_01475 [Myxococcales bacterium]|nr:hypothetical protein [Myxococcales bacterium]
MVTVNFILYWNSKEVLTMKISRLTIGLGLAAVVSLLGLVEANASPFSMFFLSDDIGNRVRATAPDASEWENDGGDSDSDTGGGESGSDTGSGTNGGGNSGGGSDDGGGDNAGDGDSEKNNNGHGNNEDGVDSSNPGNGGDNNGHGNNEDGVDSSNPGNSKAGQDSDPTVDDEMSKGDSGSKGKKK